MIITQNIQEEYQDIIKSYEGLESSFSSVEAGFSTLHARNKLTQCGLSGMEELINRGINWFETNVDLPTRRLAFRFVYNNAESARDLFELAREYNLNTDYSYSGIENTAIGFGLNSPERANLNTQELQNLRNVANISRTMESPRIIDTIDQLSQEQQYQLATLLITNFGTGWRLEELLSVDSNANLNPSVALVGDRIAGFCLLENEVIGDTETGFVETTELCVNPNYGGRGIGTLLVQDSLNSARQLFPNSLPYGEFNTSNGAAHIAQKLNGVASGQIPSSVAVQKIFRDFDVRTFPTNK
jgi:Acetyltransferase (GNAT) family